MNLSNLSGSLLKAWIVVWALPVVAVIIICHHVHIAYKNAYTPEGSGWMSPAAGAWEQGFERGGFCIGQPFEDVKKLIEQHQLSLLRFPGGDADPFTAYLIIGSFAGDAGYFVQFKDNNLWRIQYLHYRSGTRYELITSDITEVTLHSLYLQHRHYLAFESEEKWRLNGDSAMVDIADLNHGSFNRCPINYPKANEKIVSNYTSD